MRFVATITTRGGGILAEVAFPAHASAGVQFAFNLDGVDTPMIGYISDALDLMVNLQSAWSGVSVGAHTVKVRVVTGSGTFYSNMAQVEAGVLSLSEVGN